MRPITVTVAGSLLAVALGGCGRHDISGTVSGAAAGGVVVTLSGSESATATTGADGRYAFRELEDGTYTVSAALPRHTFAPGSRTVKVKGADEHGQDFVATALPGALDARFGTGGVVQQYVSQLYATGGVALQPDGKIVVAGWRISDDGHLAGTVMRLRADGALDPTFGSGGFATPPPLTFEVMDVALQGDGKVVVAGRSPVNPVTPLVLARYQADGALDASFGEGGVVTTAIGASACADALAVQPDARIVVAGSAFDTHLEVMLARYEPDGRLDATFGTGGVVTTALGAEALAHAVAIQPDGKIVAAGEWRADAGALESRTLVVRYEADGALDTGFGTGGVAAPAPFVGDEEGSLTTAVWDAAFAVAIQADGKIVTAGRAGHPEPISRVAFRDWLALARFHADGSPDAEFGAGVSSGAWWGVGGAVTAAFDGSAEAWALAIQPDGKIATAGLIRAGVEPIDPTAFLVIRCDAAGAPDASFGPDGEGVTAVADDGAAFGVAIQPDGKLVVAGYSSGGLATARYWP